MMARPWLGVWDLDAPPVLTNCLLSTSRLPFAFSRDAERRYTSRGSETRNHWREPWPWVTSVWESWGSCVVVGGWTENLWPLRTSICVSSWEDSNKTVPLLGPVIPRQTKGADATRGTPAWQFRYETTKVEGLCLFAPSCLLHPRNWPRWCLTVSPRAAISLLGVQVSYSTVDVKRHLSDRDNLFYQNLSSVFHSSNGVEETSEHTGRDKKGRQMLKGRKRREIEK